MAIKLIKIYCCCSSEFYSHETMWSVCIRLCYSMHKSSIPTNI
uniref:Uncharacterized protein n=1 Tax=Anguilla anguilla TaxID=7936 RepID=A0A0E9U391_ANGAN